MHIWGDDRPYNSYAAYFKRLFGGRVQKVAVNAGFTCPNIDGTCGTGGCIYCSARGSGDFSPEASMSLSEQYRVQTERITEKWDTPRFIPYLQAHTNTYAPAEILREKFYAALAQDGVVGMNIATRADCLAPEVLALLSELAEKTRAELADLDDLDI